MGLSRLCGSALIVLLVTVSASLAVAANGVAIPEPLLRDAAPQADRFGDATGVPQAQAAYKDGEAVGFVFSTRNVIRSTGYSAKPLDIVVGIDLDGRITGAVIAEHHEPILIVGVTDADLARFIRQYRGLSIREPVRFKSVATAGQTVDAVVGATISSVIINDAVLRSARAVASSRNLFGTGAARLRLADYRTADWHDLVADGSIRRLKVTVGEAQQAMADAGGRLFPDGMPVPPKGEPYFEIFAGLATVPTIGQNLFGERRYGTLMASRQIDDQLIFVAGRGLYSFKGRRYRRSGTFDRVQIVQGERSFRFRKTDHTGFEMLRLAGAPDFREIAVFALKGGDSGFDPTAPWRLQFFAQGVGDGADAPLATFTLNYRLPAHYVATPKASSQAAETAAAVPWQDQWHQRIIEIAVLVVGLALLTIILVFQDILAKRKTAYEIIRTGFLIYTLVWIGWIAGAQLSLINVLTFAEALMTEFRWEFFLLEPLIFVLWSYVAIALLFWGRGVFCGWLCPFGAVQELANRVGQLLRLPQWRLPFGLHERLWPLKYIFFIGIFAASLHDPYLTARSLEIEPFKTAIVLKFDRAWPYITFAVVLIGASLFTARFYCRYLCPLGAALAIPARIGMFDWLKRRWQCGTPCQICAHRCPVQAIHPDGKINPNECIYCLNCQVNYHDVGLCPPLRDRQRRRDRLRGKAAASRAPKIGAEGPAPETGTAGDA